MAGMKQLTAQDHECNAQQAQHTRLMCATCGVMTRAARRLVSQSLNTKPQNIIQSLRTCEGGAQELGDEVMS
jgi:hypothetical protein